MAELCNGVGSHALAHYRRHCIGRPIFSSSSSSLKLWSFIRLNRCSIKTTKMVDRMTETEKTCYFILLFLSHFWWLLLLLLQFLVLKKKKRYSCCYWHSVIFFFIILCPLSIHSLNYGADKMENSRCSLLCIDRKYVFFLKTFRESRSPFIRILFAMIYSCVNRR